jgi:hypothetical protein
MKLLIFSAAEIGLYFLLIYLNCFGLVECYICNFLESPFYSRYNTDFFFWGQTRFKFFVVFFGIYFIAFYFKKMSSGSSQRRVRQRTEEGIAATRARMEY